MLKFIFIYIVLYLIPLYGQPSFIVYLEGDYNYFKMDDLKKLQDELAEDYQTTLDLPVKVTESYPHNSGLQFGFLVPIKMNTKVGFSIGGFFNYTSTGGRINYEDYSGEIRHDQIATAHSLGVMFTLTTNYTEPTYSDLSLSVWMIKSSLKNKLLLQVGDYSETEEVNFNSVSIGIEPRYDKYIRIKNLSLGLSISYLLCLPTALEHDEYTDAFLTNEEGNDVSIDWGGIKFGLIIKYAL